MALLWEKLVGNTSSFACRVGFQNDPHEGAGISPDISNSWGTFQLWVDGKNLCSFSEAGELLDSVHWYLFPLLDWFVANWDSLLHEEKLPYPCGAGDAWAALQSASRPPHSIEENEDLHFQWEEAWHAWFQRHAICAAREGGIFPDIVFRRWRDQIEVSWGVSEGVGHSEHHSFSHERGATRLPVEEVARTLYETVHDALAYLHQRQPENLPVKELLRRAEQLKNQPVEKRLFWLAGLGSKSDKFSKGWAEIESAFDKHGKTAREAALYTEYNSLAVTGSCHAALMYGSITPSIGSEDIIRLAEQMATLTSEAPESAALLERVHSKAVIGDNNAWNEGYDLAQSLLDSLEDMPHVISDFVDVELLVKYLEIEVAEISLSDNGIRGVAIAGSQHRPGILINLTHDANRYPSGRRFTIAHELCHILHDRSLGKRLALVSGPWAPPDTERRANAFAAMLLMPPQLLTGINLASLVDAMQLTKRLQVSLHALLRHLSNLGFITESQREAWQLRVEYSAVAGLSEASA